MAISKEAIERSKTARVLNTFLYTEKPKAEHKEKTTLLNIRIDEKLRDDYKRLCFDKKTDMSREIINFIIEQLENS